MKTDAQTLAETLNKIAFPRERAEAFQRADDISIRTFFHLHSERVYLCRDGSGFIYRGTTSAAGCGHIPNWHTTHELVLAGELPDYIKPIRA